MAAPPTLVHLNGSRRGAVDELGTAGALIGRDPARCHVVIADVDDAVSRVHAQVFVDQGRWWVVDKGSSKGTRVHGRDATTPQPLEEGTTIELGGAVSLQFTEKVTLTGRTPVWPFVALVAVLGVLVVAVPQLRGLVLPDRVAEEALPDRVGVDIDLDVEPSAGDPLREHPFPAAIRRMMQDLSGDTYACPIPDLFLQDVRDELVAMFKTRKSRCRMEQWRPVLREVLMDEGAKRSQPPGRAHALVYLPWVESAYTTGNEPNHRACSAAGARGMWQFMPATARTYGMTVGESLDQRCHWDQAARAAMNLLGDLFERCGADHPLLAIAGYNTGGARSCKHATGDPCESFDFRPFYVRGTLHDETTEYVPRFVASWLIGEQPQLALAIARERDAALKPLPRCPEVAFTPPTPRSCNTGRSACLDRR